MKKKKSPFLKDKPSGTLPEITQSIYLKELLERSKKARKKLDEFKRKNNLFD